MAGADTIVLAVDNLRRGKREELYLALLTYAGPPPTQGRYTEWCNTCEKGIMLLYPHWGMVDVLDATVQYRHWCNKRGARRARKEKIDGLLNWLARRMRL